MVRALVKNTFLAFDDFSEEVNAPGNTVANARSRSWTSPGSRTNTSPSAVLDDHQRKCLEGLNHLLNSERDHDRFGVRVQGAAPQVVNSKGAQNCADVQDADLNLHVVERTGAQEEDVICVDESLPVKALGKGLLKQVQSNNSVSTMAPDDWDEGLEEHPDMHPEESFESVTTAETFLVDAAEKDHALAMPNKVFQHARVPKSVNLAEEFSKVKTECPPTTMMIRNIPNRYNQRELITELEGLGFAGSFDFFYAPIDTSTMGNVGYAFVNFLEPRWAELSREVLEGYAFKKHQQKARRKVATVSVAHLQGLQANIRHYENAAVNARARSKRCGPVIMTKIASALDAV